MAGVRFSAPRHFGKLNVFDTFTLRLEKCPEFIEGQFTEIANIFSMFFVYILRGDKNHIYVGSTDNIEKRIIRHKSGHGAEFTKRNKAFELVYSESFPTLVEARRREKQIKGWRREKKEDLIKFGKPII